MTDTASPEVPKTFVSKILDAIPRLLSSKIHIAWLFILFLWIVVLAALFPNAVSQRTELILGNYTNVTSAIGACIAAGGTVVAVKHLRHQSKLQEAQLDIEKERHALAQESHKMITALYSNEKHGDKGPHT